MLSSRPRMPRRVSQLPAIQAGLRLGVVSALAASVLVLPVIASAQSAANAALIPPPVTQQAVATGDLARVWSEAVDLERTSWDLEESDLDRSYDLAIQAARRFEAISEWLPGAPTSDVEPYHHAYWRTARVHWLAAEKLELADRERRREHLSRAIEFADRGLSANPECAPCMLWKFNSMGRRQQIDGLFSGARNVKAMAKLLDQAILLQPDFREGERSSTLGNLHYVSAIFYRVLPDWFWLKWIIGVRGDNERALDHARTAVAMHPSRVDYRIEVGSQLLCLGMTHEDEQRLAEGRRIMAEATTMAPYNLHDEREIAAAHVMIAAPGKSCSYAGAEWVEIDEDGAVASMRE